MANFDALSWMIYAVLFLALLVFCVNQFGSSIRSLLDGETADYERDGDQVSRIRHEGGI